MSSADDHKSEIGERPSRRVHDLQPEPSGVVLLAGDRLAARESVNRSSVEPLPRLGIQKAPVLAGGLLSFRAASQFVNVAIMLRCMKRNRSPSTLLMGALLVLGLAIIAASVLMTLVTF